MKYQLSNGIVEIKQDKRKQLLNDIKQGIIDFCYKERRIPTIEEFNRFQRLQVPLNHILIQENMKFSKLINSLNLVQTKRGVYRSIVVKEQFRKWFNEEKMKRGQLPSYHESIAYIQDHITMALYGSELNTFLKEFGIKQDKGGKKVIRHMPKKKDEALKIVEGLLEKDTFVFVAKKGERHVIKVVE